MSWFCARRQGLHTKPDIGPDRTAVTIMTPDVAGRAHSPSQYLSSP